jgi:tRNA pseudouridine38-40 synthase
VTTWKLTLEYDGTKYSGWQEQKNARTVMGALRTAAEDLLGSGLDIQGAGRTDAGVHALAQVAHLRAPGPAKRPPEMLRRGLNDRLPADIVVLEVEPASARFHARHDAVSRRYLYQISTRKTAFAKKYVWWVKETLDIPLMEQAAHLLEGRRDYSCFRAIDASRENDSPIVEVRSAKITLEEHFIAFRIEASHFLWRMVRRIVGVLVKLGKGEIRIDDWKQLLEARSAPELDVAAWTAPASGLFLEQVRYRSKNE